MKRLLMFIFILALTHTAYGQRRPSSTGELAQMLNQNHKDSLDKIRAAYRWVVMNIRYSTEKTFVMNNSIDPRAVIDVAFQRRAGVCENFAAIFTDVCRKMGFRAMVIEGYGVQNNRADRVAHSWSAVYVDEDWFLFDPTWDAGRSSGFSFFKKSGEEFIATHKPFDPIWQLLFHPGTESNAGIVAYFNYKDSIDAFLSLDSLKKLETALDRVGSSSQKNELTDTHQKVLSNQLEIQREEQQMEWYAKAVDKINEVSERLNDFIDLRNEQFSSVKEMSKLTLLLDRLDVHLDSARNYLTKIDQSKASLVYGTEPAREQISKLEKKYKEQQHFLQQYLVTDTNQRMKMF